MLAFFMGPDKEGAAWIVYQMRFKQMQLADLMHR